MRTNRGDDGASLVEFALILPVLALFLFGIIQFGLAYDKKQSINSAAREGARSAAIPDDSNNRTAIVSRVDAAYNGLLDGDLDTVIIEVVDAQNPAVVLKTVSSDADGTPCKDHPGENVVVTAQDQHTITIPFMGTMNPTLEGRGEFRCEIDQ